MKITNNKVGQIWLTKRGNIVMITKDFNQYYTVVLDRHEYKGSFYSREFKNGTILYILPYPYPEQFEYKIADTLSDYISGYDMYRSNLNRLYPLGEQVPQFEADPKELNDLIKSDTFYFYKDQDEWIAASLKAQQVGVGYTPSEAFKWLKQALNTSIVLSKKDARLIPNHSDSFNTEMQSLMSLYQAKGKKNVKKTNTYNYAIISSSFQIKYAKTLIDALNAEHNENFVLKPM